MHIAIIGASALILFLIIGGLFIAAVVLEQRDRRRLAATAKAEPSPEPAAPVIVVQKPKVMAATAGH
jgi:fructose-specific phosphotransferase system IIC component